MYKLKSEEMQNIITKYGIPMGHATNFREFLYEKGHTVISDVQPNQLVLTSCEDHMCIVGYNDKRDVCYALYPKERPSTPNTNYLACVLHGQYVHCIREATYNEVVASFEQERDGEAGIIYPTNIDSFGTHIESGKTPCWVECAFSANYREDRLISDTVSINDGQVTYYGWAEVEEDNKIDFNTVRNQFFANYDFGDDNNPVQVTITNLLTDESYEATFPNVN